MQGTYFVCAAREIASHIAADRVRGIVSVQYWRSVATEGEEWERRYAQLFGGPFPRLLLDKYENSSYVPLTPSHQLP